MKQPRITPNESVHRISPPAPRVEAIDEQAAAWLVRRQDGLSAHEEAAFQAWLDVDPRHARALERMASVWQQLDTLPAEQIAARRGDLPVPAPWSSAPSSRRAWLAGSARAGLALSVVGGAWVGWAHWHQQPVFAQSFATIRGQQQELSLPDGSRLQLDTDTRAEVTIYRDRREVVLAGGQASFSVERDPERPFIVQAGALRVRVVGTRFSVRHTGVGLGAVGASVSVESGHVRVQARAAGAQADTEAVDLRAGQGVAMTADGSLAPLATQEARAALAWRERRLVLDDTPLPAVLAEFDRYLDTRLVIADPAVARLRLTGHFDLNQFNAFKRALPQVLPVRLVARADGRTELAAAP